MTDQPVPFLFAPLAAARPRIAIIIDNNVSRDNFGQPEPDDGYSAGGR
jgi:hypothetical protein